MSAERIRTTIFHGYEPEVRSKRVLLFNPPVYDTRFPWSGWQQPVALLQLATLLRRYECDVRLVDALDFKSDEVLTRRRIRILTRSEVSINYWRYGRLQSELAAQLESWKKENWQPEAVCQVVCRISEPGWACDADGIVSVWNFKLRMTA